MRLILNKNDIVLDREVKKGSRGGVIYVPIEHVGKKVKIIVLDED